VNVVVGEELLGVAGVFAGDLVHFLEGYEGRGVMSSRLHGCTSVERKPAGSAAIFRRSLRVQRMSLAPFRRRLAWHAYFEVLNSLLEER